MTDRELLEKAAKAADWHWDTYDEQYGLVAHLNPDESCGWNPLEDDGDALRLAVRLRLEIVPIEGGGVDVERTTEQEPFGELLATESGLDPYACTRRAIVRAAASLAGDL